MKRIIVVTGLLLGSLSAAAASTHFVGNYRDLVRPHGHPRGAAIHQADLAMCYRETGQDRTQADTPAFKSCMLGHGYRWLSTEEVQDPPRRNTQSAGRYIDPDTGMSCKNQGGVAICDPPNGTVKYYDPEQGLNCTRTGLVAVCSNL